MIACSRCTLSGHTDENCWIKPPVEGDKMDTDVCGYCVLTGHIGRDCPELTGAVANRLSLRKKREEKFGEVLDSLEMMWMLVTNEVASECFENCVTDSTGTIDEGVVRASNIMGYAEKVLREHGRLDTVSRGPV